MPATRVNRTKDNDITDIMVITICSILCGGETFSEMEDFGQTRHEWLKSFLKLHNGIPSHDTFALSLPVAGIAFLNLQGYIPLR